jgi:LCP family protein required for cell wall assembly
VSKPPSPGRTPGIAAFLSAVLPGAGQFWLGRRRRGLLLALPALAVVGVLVYFARRGAAGLAEMLVQPVWLWALIGVNAAVLLLRLGALADAWFLAKPAGLGWKRGLAGLTPALLVAAALTFPQVVVHRYAVDALDLLNKVFVQPQQVSPLAERVAELLAQGFSVEDLGPDLATTTTSTTEAATTSAPTSTTGSTGPTTTTTTIPFNQAFANQIGEHFVTVLLAGGDFGPGRSDLRTDVMIVAALDLDTGKAALIGISRDLTQAPLPAAWASFNTMLQVQQWHEDRAYQQAVDAAVAAGDPIPDRPPFVSCGCYYDRLNYLHVHTANWVVTFPDAPDPGMEALRQTLEVTLGIPIDYYVLVDFAGFVDLVDAIGGIDVTATESMHIAFSPAKEGEPSISINITPGPQHFDGRTALAYVRNRTGSNDGQRMLRQRCMLRQLAAELDASTLLTHFEPIAHAIANSTTSTIPLNMLPGLIRAVSDLGPGDIVTGAIGYPGQTLSQTNYMGLPIIDPAKVRAKVASIFADLAAGTTGEGSADECG